MLLNWKASPVPDASEVIQVAAPDLVYLVRIVIAELVGVERVVLPIGHGVGVGHGDRLAVCHIEADGRGNVGHAGAEGGAIGVAHAVRVRNAEVPRPVGPHGPVGAARKDVLDTDVR